MKSFLAMLRVLPSALFFFIVLFALASLYEPAWMPLLAAASLDRLRFVLAWSFILLIPLAALIGVFASGPKTSPWWRRINVGLFTIWFATVLFLSLQFLLDI